MVSIVLLFMNTSCWTNRLQWWNPRITFILLFVITVKENESGMTHNII